MRYPLPVVVGVFLVTLLGGSPWARARGVPEFGCTEVQTTRIFGTVLEEDCAPANETTCFDHPLDPPVPVDTHNYPSNCKWVTAQSSNTVTMATCLLRLISIHGQTRKRRARTTTIWRKLR